MSNNINNTILYKDNYVHIMYIINNIYNRFFQFKHTYFALASAYGFIFKIYFSLTFFIRHSSFPFAFLMTPCNVVQLK